MRGIGQVLLEAAYSICTHLNVCDAVVGGQQNKNNKYVATLSQIIQASEDPAYL